MTAEVFRLGKTGDQRRQNPGIDLDRVSRAAERGRPINELEYIDRLLRQF